MSEKDTTDAAAGISGSSNATDLNDMNEQELRTVLGGQLKTIESLVAQIMEHGDLDESAISAIDQAHELLERARTLSN